MSRRAEGRPAPRRPLSFLLPPFSRHRAALPSTPRVACAPRTRRAGMKAGAPREAARPLTRPHIPHAASSMADAATASATSNRAPAAAAAANASPSPSGSAAVHAAAPPSLIENNASPATTYEHVLDCVLKVFCTHCEPNYELPWTVTPQRISTSSAFVIAGRRILTNAHSVQHHTTVKVKRRDSDTKYAASVVAVGNECDIALLSVEDESFWRHFEERQQRHDASLHDDDADDEADGEADDDDDDDDDENEEQRQQQEQAPPYLTPGPLPHLQDPVLVIGYPSPGNQISVTAGVTSRVEMQHYVYGQGDLLTVQIDAAINAGNSGGPVINDQHQVIGIAFQSIDPSQADSVGYFIPYCIVQHFLDDIATHGRYTGFPFCGFRWQRMESAYLRRANGMSGEECGILVKWVAGTSDASRVLRKGDIVTHIDGISVSNAGTVPFRSGERIGLDFLITCKFSNDFVCVSFLRHGRRHAESYQLSSIGDHRLVPVHDSRHPGYIVFGGLLFQILSEPFLRAVYGHNWLLEAPVRLIDEYYRGTRTKEGRMEIVVLTQILATDVTSGYEQEDGNDAVLLRRVNGVEVLSLAHLNEVLDAAQGRADVCFELEDDDVIILDKVAAEEAEAFILKTHCIPAARSIARGSPSAIKGNA